MKITNAHYTATGSITALVDGVQMFIPADAGNRHYAAMLEQGTEPLPADPVVTAGPHTELPEDTIEVVLAEMEALKARLLKLSAPEDTAS